MKAAINETWEEVGIKYQNVYAMKLCLIYLA